MMFVVACQNLVVTDSFCLWAEHIRLTKEEINTLSDFSLRQINNFNQEIEVQCDGD